MPQPTSRWTFPLSTSPYLGDSLSEQNASRQTPSPRRAARCWGSVDRSKLAFRGLVGVRTLGAFADSAMLPFVVLWARRDVGLSGRWRVCSSLLSARGVGRWARRRGAGRPARSSPGPARFHRRDGCRYGSLFAVRQPVVALSAFFIAGLFESAFHPRSALSSVISEPGPSFPAHTPWSASAPTSAGSVARSSARLQS